MGIIKEIFGAILFIFGSMNLAHTFMDAPYGENFSVCFGSICGGLIISSICLHFGLKWLKWGKKYET